MYGGIVMSTWTHVNGSVRYDFSILVNKAKEPIFKTADYNSSKHALDECNVPLGSEGSITVGKSVVYQTDNGTPAEKELIVKEGIGRK